MDIKTLLMPYASQPGGAVWDYFLYGILLMQFILLILLFNGSLRDVIMVGAIFLAAIADKLYLFGFTIDPDAPGGSMGSAVNYHIYRSFFTYAIRVMMFAFPMLITTQTKISKAKPMAILLTIASIVYFAGRWTFQQRVAGQNDLSRGQCARRVSRDA